MAHEDAGWFLQVPSGTGACGYLDPGFPMKLPTQKLLRPPTCPGEEAHMVDAGMAL
jgi:hypothetical protein